METFMELLIEDVALVLLNIDGRLINPIRLLENWAAHMLSGGFLVTLSSSGLYLLHLMLSRVAMFHYVHLK